MSTAHTAIAEEYLSPFSRNPNPHVDENLLRFLERSLLSIRAEIAAGTPVDPRLVDEIELRIKRLRTGDLS